MASMPDGFVRHGSGKRSPGFAAQGRCGYASSSSVLRHLAFLRCALFG